MGLALDVLHREAEGRESIIWKRCHGGWPVLLPVACPYSQTQQQLTSEWNEGGRILGLGLEMDSQGEREGRKEGGREGKVDEDRDSSSYG